MFFTYNRHMWEHSVGERGQYIQGSGFRVYSGTSVVEVYEKGYFLGYGGGIHRCHSSRSRSDQGEVELVTLKLPQP